VGIGVVDGKPTDVGRFTVTKEEKDTGAFKTPTLRDVARSAPYFHDGSVASLREAVTLMAKGGVPNKFLDKTNLEPRNLSEAQIRRRRRFPELAHRTDGTQGSQSAVRRLLRELDGGHLWLGRLCRRRAVAIDESA
jgi:cytochrome c peroxidase